MPADTLVAEPAGDVLGGPERALGAATIGQSSARRIAGPAGQEARPGAPGGVRAAPGAAPGLPP